MSFPKYPRYKDSGVDWLGEVPEHWRAGSLRWLALRYSGGTPDKTNIGYWEGGTVPWLNSGAVNDRLITTPSALITQEAFENSSAKWIPVGGLVMALAGQGKTKGMVAQLGFRSTCNQSMAAIIPGEELNARFLFWWLDSNYENIRNLAGGDLRDGLNLELLGNIKCPIPEPAEQSRIAAFLDRESAKIDALVTEQRRLIELLKEKRQAVISHAVTKGLNPHAPMKPSGVEWLGDVPTHWDVLPFRRIVTRIVVGIAEAATHAYAETGVPIVRSTNINSGEISESDMLFISPAFAERLAGKALRAGDIVTTRTGVNVGISAVVPPSLHMAQCFTLLISSPNAESNPFFYNHFINAYPGRTYVELTAWGSSQPNISVPILQEMSTVRPPKNEQDEVVRYIEQAARQFDELVKKAEQTIDLLQERRTALISAAVAGKIDVRGLAETEAA